jgi:NADH-quinone oxidoreductase subunit G
LPACSWAEADGTYVNVKNIAQRSARAIPPQGDSRPGWELSGRIGVALGHPTRWLKLGDIHNAMAPEAGAVAAVPAQT